MNLVYADEQGNLFDHPEWMALDEVVIWLLS